MGKSEIPERWLPYSPMGTVIPGTSFIACKVPLKEGILRSLPEKERFGTKSLLDAFPKMGMLVDLTNTTRYYCKEDFTEKNIRYEKIFCPGKVVPPNSIIKQFFGVVDDFLAAKDDPDAVIVVHCTHGVNRTGYFICRYMIEKLNMSPDEAIKNFQKGRGHPIERDSYVSDLKNGCKGGRESDLRFVSNGNCGGGRQRDGRQRDGRRWKTKSNSGFQERPYNRNDEVPEKKQKKDNTWSKNNPRGRKWVDGKRSHTNSNSGGQEIRAEVDKYSYNWRNPPLPTTTPISGFAPVHYQGRSMSPYQPLRPHSHREVPPVDSFYSGSFRKKGNFKAPQRVESGDLSYKTFSPLPKFCQPNMYNETLQSPRYSDGITPNPETFSHTPPGNHVSSQFKGHYRGSKTNRGGHRRGRGSHSRGGSQSWGKGKNSQGYNISS